MRAKARRPAARIQRIERGLEEVIIIPTRTQELKGSVQDVVETALLTLGNGTGILSAGPVMTRGGRMLSTIGSISIRGITAGDGPWLCGIASKSLTLAQLEEYLENQGPTHPEDTENVERAGRGRLIRVLDTLVPSGNGTTAAIFLRNHSLSGLPFTEESAGWNWWCYNLGATLQTGALVRFQFSSFVSWNRSG